MRGAPHREVPVLVQHIKVRTFAAFAAAAISVLASPAAAQDERVWRVTLGGAMKPKYPGSDNLAFGPVVNVDRKKPEDTFIFEAPDESFDLQLVDSGGFSLGPVFDYRGVRKEDVTGVILPKVKLSLEPGAFVAFQPSESFRMRVEGRKGVTGHKGWIVDGAADFILRDRDEWLFSIGPRVTWTDNRYQDAYFGVTPAAAPVAGLPAYNPDGGIQSFGATATFLTKVSGPWGIYTYAKYERMVNDPADSPIVRQLGSRDQISGGLALSYTFTRR